ncbi:MAG: hypothetical protein IT276_10610 [Ignavibacteriaceae bacterium]|nr:hypothetical protein [Ignavibacteriaceae bacterium]
MNSEKELLSRLLKFYPVSVVREHIKSKNIKMDDIIDDFVSNNVPKNIYSFAKDNFDITKQHIYFFSHNLENINNLPKEIFSEKKCYSRNIKSDSITYFYFINIAYKVIVDGNPPHKEEILFEVPMQIVFEKNILRFDFTIIEKNISSYIRGNNRILSPQKSRDEFDIIELAKVIISQFCKIEVLDLHKGVKYLWAKKEIDATKIRYRKTKSISMESMDEEYSLREVYPELYEEMKNKPLESTIFKFTSSDVNLYKHFVVDPKDGKLAFRLYPNNILTKENVIRKILKNN